MKGSKFLKTCAISLAVLLPISVWIAQQPTPKLAPGKPDRNAVFSCTQAIQETLNDPDSAVFDYTNSYAFYDKENDQWIANIEFRAKNAFNAMIFAQYTCFVRVDGDDTEVLHFRPTR